MSLPLSLRLQPSPRAVAALLVVHGLALVAIASSPLAAPLAVGASTIAIASCIASTRLHAARSANAAIVACTLRPDAELELERRSGLRVVTHIEASSTVLHWLVVLQLRDGKRRQSLVLLPDMMDAETWRCLAVALRAQRK